MGVAFAASFVGSVPPVEPSENVTEVDDPSRFEEILAGGGVVMVDFYADWCGPCRRLKPTIHELADEYDGRVTVVTVNVDNAKELARQRGIRSIPDIRFFKAGEEEKRVVGAKAKEAYTAILDDLLNAS
jgi:thioredoxin 1